MDTYQPIYDAVRSKIHNGDIGSAVRDALGNTDISFQVNQVKNRAIEAIAQYDTPFIIYKGKLDKRGSEWCANFGDIAGWGRSPAEAVEAFNKNWYEKLP